MAFRWRADNSPLLVALGRNLKKKMLSELDPLWQNFVGPRMQMRRLSRLSATRIQKRLDADAESDFFRS